MEEFDRIANDSRNYVASSTEQYNVVQPSQGGGAEYKQIVRWNREPDAEQWSSRSSWTWSPSSRSSWLDSSSSRTQRQSQQPTFFDVPALVLNARKNTSSGRLVAATQISFDSFCSSSKDNPNGGCTQIHTLSSAVLLRRTFDALRTLQHFYGSSSD